MASALSRIFNLTGVHNILTMGKRGNIFDAASAGIFKFFGSDGSTLARVQAATPTDINDVVTLGYLEQSYKYRVTGQIDGGSPPAVADGEVYIVTTTGGAYTAGELYIGQGGSWVAANREDGSIISMADALTGGTETYEAGHLYAWDEETTAWGDKGPAPAESTNVKILAPTTVNFDSGASVSLGTLPAGARIDQVDFYVDTAFDDDAATLTIGDGTTADLIADVDDTDLAETGQQQVNQFVTFASATELTVTLSAGTSTAGAVLVEVKYSIT